MYMYVMYVSITHKEFAQSWLHTSTNTESADKDSWGIFFVKHAFYSQIEIRVEVKLVFEQAY